MNAEKQNRVIAEFAGVQTEGWWCPKCDREVGCASVKFDETHDLCGSPVEPMPVHDYTRDLNAIREASLALLAKDPFAYRQMHGHLTKIVAIANSAVEHGYYLLDATSEQRAEALLRTIGKWEDGE